MTQASQVALYGELLTSQEQYTSDVARLPKLSQQEEQALVVRARERDNQARDALILSCQRYVSAVALHYVRVYAYEAPHRIEYLDLVQIGNVELVEQFEKALTCENPCAYLNVAARGAIIEYCTRYSSLVRVPKARKDEPKLLPSYIVDSYDVPVPYKDKDKESVTLREILPASTQKPRKENEYVELHQAVETLSEKLQLVITRHYGLDGEPESLYEISRSLCKEGSKPSTSATAYNYKNRALVSLRKKLEGVYANA